MIRVSLIWVIVALIIANLMVSLAVCRLITLDPSSEILSASPFTPSKHDLNQLSIERVKRQSNPVVTRLFGLPVETIVAVRTPEPDVPQAETTMRLVGIIFTNDTTDEMVALIEHGTPKRVTRLRVGTQLDSSGWHVDRILPSYVELIRGRERSILRLDY